MLNKWLNGWSCEGQLEVEVSILKRNWFWHDSVTQISTIDSVRVAPKPSSPKPLPPFSDCHLIMLSLSGAHVWEGLIWFRLCHPSPDSRWWRWGGGGLQWVNGCYHHTSLSTHVSSVDNMWSCDVSLWQDKRQLRSSLGLGFHPVCSFGSVGICEWFSCGPDGPIKLPVCLEVCYINVNILTV